MVVDLQVLTNTCLGNMGLDLVASCLAGNPLDANIRPMAGKPCRQATTSPSPDTHLTDQ